MQRHSGLPTALAALMLSAVPPCAFAGVDYTEGLFIVNEDWYGHQNSTVNYLLPDSPDGECWHYRAFQAENPGKELGCTNQYGTIFNGRFYFIAKQEKDPGAKTIGGRITVADAHSMKLLHQQTLIDPSGAQCDGRSFIGVDPHKGYVSSSNGVWVFDLDSYTITGQVEGTANPYAGKGNDKPNYDPTGSLYKGQSGTMVAAAGKIFLAHQEYGLLVIDPALDKVTDTIPMDIASEGAGIGSVVKAKDGSLWISVASDKQGLGSTVLKLVRLDPATLATEVIELPAGGYAPSNSWYAWTPDSFCASSIENTLYWQGSENTWFCGENIFRYDIDKRELTKIIDLKADGENWKLYGCSMRVDPRTDDLYMSLYHEFGDPTYITRRYTSSGVKVRDYDMISNYWFPSIPVFPEEAYLAGIDAVTTESSGRLSFSNGEIVCHGLAGEQLTLLTLSGQTAAVYRITESAEHISPMLPAGIYIARCGNSVLKFSN